MVFFYLLPTLSIFFNVKIQLSVALKLHMTRIRIRIESNAEIADPQHWFNPFSRSGKTFWSKKVCGKLKEVVPNFTIFRWIFLGEGGGVGFLWFYIHVNPVNPHWDSTILRRSSPSLLVAVAGDGLSGSQVRLPESYATPPMSHATSQMLYATSVVSYAIRYSTWATPHP
jgi:hypothetical protein